LLCEFIGYTSVVESNVEEIAYRCQLNWLAISD
jgi:hypothetical protein